MSIICWITMQMFDKDALFGKYSRHILRSTIKIVGPGYTCICRFCDNSIHIFSLLCHIVRALHRRGSNLNFPVGLTNEVGRLLPYLETHQGTLVSRYRGHHDTPYADVVVIDKMNTNLLQAIGCSFLLTYVSYNPSMYK